MRPERMLQALRALYDARAEELRSRYNRLLPFGDMVSDRWEKARRLGFGEGTSIYDSALVFGDVAVGRHTWIGPGVVLDGAGAPLRIGDYCSLAGYTQIYTHDTVAWAVTGGKAAYAYAPVTLGSCVYVGPNTVIAKGVAIGSHAIIGAQSFVNSSLPDYSVAWGRPARIVGAVRMAEDGNAFHIDFSNPA